jgi:hypothetical protein
MATKQKVKIIALTISIFYVGIGSIKLASIINNDRTIFNNLGETFDAIFVPSYAIGFTLGFGGGDFFAIIGQIITLGLIFGISYAFMFSIAQVIERRHSKK